jgi:hypothetical protein
MRTEPDRGRHAALPGRAGSSRTRRPSHRGASVRPRARWFGCSGPWAAWELRAADGRTHPLRTHQPAAAPRAVPFAALTAPHLRPLLAPDAAVRRHHELTLTRTATALRFWLLSQHRSARPGAWPVRTCRGARSTPRVMDTTTAPNHRQRPTSTRVTTTGRKVAALKLTRTRSSLPPKPSSATG